MSRLFSWTLNAVYLTVMLLASPWILWSAFKHGKYREGFAEKLWGLVPERSGNRPCVWLHAVSVGEVNLLATTLKEIAGRQPDWELVISTTTKAGYDLARKKYADHTVFYCPLDLSWATQRAMRRVRPDLLVLAELELWPNLIAAAKGQGARVAIINGRLSDTSFRGYSRVSPVVSRVLSMIDLIAAQNVETAERFRKLGARKESVHATGSLKFDGAITDRENQRTRHLRELADFTANDIVFLAGSTQSPEEEIALRIYQQLVTDFPQLKLVLVPRHPQRFDEVAELLASSGVTWMRRSELVDSALLLPSSALLVDTIGELGAWWGTATVGFVGGSFGSRGGQNMIEPAAYGVATCFGPNTWNFRDIVGQLLAVDGARVVRDEAELAAFVRRVLAEPEWGKKLGERAQRLVLEQQGATARTVELLLPLVGESALESRAA
ncbi:MAG: 3-deoxy-D-manno-octulosonic acid transferase [Bythopirellula sp.]|nr:3-deoxy-D-manno-octulosonic acid transferase [Bythopirellula sp.]